MLHGQGADRVAPAVKVIFMSCSRGFIHGVGAARHEAAPGKHLLWNTTRRTHINLHIVRSLRSQTKDGWAPAGKIKSTSEVSGGLAHYCICTGVENSRIHSKNTLRLCRIANPPNVLVPGYCRSSDGHGGRG